MAYRTPPTVLHNSPRAHLGTSEGETRFLGHRATHTSCIPNLKPDDVQHHRTKEVSRLALSAEGVPLD
jgi:hypothetical protein